MVKLKIEQKESISIFSCPKPFIGHNDIIQRNAITSWTLLKPRPEITLLGNEKGTKKICDEMKLRHIPEIDYNEFGKPILSDIIEKGRRAATNNILCYINADIILFTDLMTAIKNVNSRKSKFLIIGKRWNLNTDKPIDFTKGWERFVKSAAYKECKGGRLNSFNGIDYFVFHKYLWKQIPPFCIGRPANDWWLVYNAHSEKVAVVDVSRVVMAVHQNHERAQDFSYGPEALLNYKLAGDTKKLARNGTIASATHILTKNGLRKALINKERIISSRVFLDFFMYLGKIGGYLKKHSPYIYEILKPVKENLYELFLPRRYGD